MKTGYSFGSLVNLVETIDRTTVKLSGDQTIDGLKGFNQNPYTNAAQGQGGGYLTRKDYVDNALSYKANTASPAFTGNPTAPTAPLFDVDTTVATTQFVQRALGNHQQYVWTVDATLEHSWVGSFVRYAGAGALYLPDYHTVPMGSRFDIMWTGGGRLAAQAGQILFLPNGTSVDSVTPNIGDTVAVVRLDAGWAYSGTSYTPTAAVSDNSTRPASTAFVKNYLNSSPALAGNIRLTGNLEVTDKLSIHRWFSIDGAATRDSWDLSIDGNVPVEGTISCAVQELPNHEVFFPMISNTSTTKGYGYTFRAKFGTYSTGYGSWGDKQAAIWVGSAESTTHPHYVFKFSAYGDFTCAKVFATSYDINGDTLTRGSSTINGNASINGTVYTNHLVSNYDIITGTQPRGANNTYVATTAFVQNELSHNMSTVSYAMSNGSPRWFKIGWLTASNDGSLDTFHAFGTFGAWAGAKHAFSLTATNRDGLKVNCESDIQMPFYFFQLAGGDIDIFVRLDSWQIMSGQTWSAPVGQSVAWRFGELPDVEPTGTQVATTFGSTKRYAYLTSPSFDGTVNMAGALNVNGTTTTNGLIVTSGTDFRGGISVSGGSVSVPNGGVTAASMTATSSYGYRMVYGPYGSIDYQDDNHRYILLTNRDDQLGGFNGLRPFAIELASGKVTMAHGVVVSGGLNINDTTTTNSLVVVGGTDFRAGVNVSGGDLYLTNGRVDAGGTVVSRASVGFRMVYGAYGSIDYQDDATRCILLTNANDQWGSFNALRPFAVDLASGKVTMSNGVVVSGGLNINDTTTTNSLVVVGGTDFRAGVTVSGGGLYLPNGRVDAGGTVVSRNRFGFRLTYGPYGSIDYQDDATRCILLTNANDQLGGFNGLRPFAIDLASGKVSMMNGVVVKNGFKVNDNMAVGNISTPSGMGNLAVQNNINADGAIYERSSRVYSPNNPPPGTASTGKWRKIWSGSWLRNQTYDLGIDLRNKTLMIEVVADGCTSSGLVHCNDGTLQAQMWNYGNWWYHMRWINISTLKMINAGDNSQALTGVWVYE